MKRVVPIPSFALGLALIALSPARAAADEGSLAPAAPGEANPAAPALPPPDGAPPGAEAPATSEPGRPPAPSPTPEPSAPPPEFVPAPPVTLAAEPEPDEAPRAREAARELYRLNFGMRVGYVATSGFDTFASNDTLAQLSIDGAAPVLTRGDLVLAVGLGWDVGGRSDNLRGLEASLTAHRLYVPIEARYHLARPLFAFAKLSPGATAAVVSVTEPSSPSPLSTTAWAFSGDLSAGASVLLGPRSKSDRPKRALQFWLTPELGWAYTTSAPLRLRTEREDEEMLGADESVTLRSLALSGFFWRATLAATF